MVKIRVEYYNEPGYKAVPYFTVLYDDPYSGRQRFTSRSSFAVAFAQLEDWVRAHANCER